MPRHSRGKSKGMRKHIRKEKAKQRKRESSVKLPDYNSFPLTSGIIGMLTRATCPKCGCKSSGPVVMETQQGEKILRQCPSCKTIYRYK
jgi:hypothetical protein